jgi:NADH-quinone oxidoreductase subunit A
MNAPSDLLSYLPVGIQIGAALFFAVATLLTSVILGKKAITNPTKDSAYECGKLAEGVVNPRFSVKFYLIAMLFILFDIETVFMYVWGVIYRDQLQQSFMIFGSMLSFVGILFVGYIYALKKGAFEWAK